MEIEFVIAVGLASGAICFVLGMFVGERWGKWQDDHMFIDAIPPSVYRDNNRQRAENLTDIQYPEVASELPRHDIHDPQYVADEINPLPAFKGDKFKRAED